VKIAHRLFVLFSISALLFFLIFKRVLTELVFISVTRRVKGDTRFVGKYVTGRRKRFRPHKVCPSVRMNAEILETRSYNTGIRQIPEIPAQRRFVSAMCHAHKQPKTLAPTVLMLE